MNHAKLITISGIVILVLSLSVGLLYVQDRLTIIAPAQTISEDSCLLDGGSIVSDPGSCPSGNTVQIDYGSGTSSGSGSTSPGGDTGGNGVPGGDTSGGTSGSSIAYCCRLPEDPVEPETPTEEPRVDPTTPPEPTKVPDSPTPVPPSEVPNPPTPVPSPTSPPTGGDAGVPTVPPGGDPPTSTPQPAITDSGPSPTPNDGGGDSDGTSGDSCEIPAFTVTTRVKECFNCSNQ